MTILSIDSTKTKKLIKSFGTWDIIFFGIGSIVGSGVFILTGVVASIYTGPAIIISYLISGTVCILMALNYTELITMQPTSGGVYSYCYLSFGEIFAWVTASILILELGGAAATVAIAWSAYLNNIINSLGIELPKYIASGSIENGYVDILAVFIVVLLGILLYLGTKESKMVNRILVLVKLSSISVFIILSYKNVNPNNWNDFMPFGKNGILVGSSILFFAFNGYGVLATTAEECKNPKYNLGIGIIVSIVIATIIYMLVGAVLTGVIYYKKLNTSSALILALQECNSSIGCKIVTLGAILGMISTILLNMYAITRIFFVVSRDNLLPTTMSKLHPKHNSPYKIILIFTLLIALVAGFSSYKLLSSLSSMGTLTNNIVITLSVMFLRFKYPNQHRIFKSPMLFLLSPIAMLISVYLLYKQIIDSNRVLTLAGKIIISWITFAALTYLIKYVASTKCKTIPNITKHSN
ncbi:amino acid permease [Rickettsia endosymbiont of Cardiosporidium cionae]|nr:amino acid permease [Rickettsia endosymbiont of Cardiosporidium cionae]